MIPKCPQYERGSTGRLLSSSFSVAYKLQVARTQTDTFLYVNYFITAAFKTAKEDSKEHILGP